MTKVRTAGFTLIEVTVSAVVLGVIAISYAAFFRAQDNQRNAQERLVYAMEISTRQIEFIRQSDETLASTDPRAAPFSSAFQAVNKTIPMSYTGGTLESASGNVGLPEGTFLTSTNSYSFDKAGANQYHWLAAPINTYGPTPPELLMPREMSAAGGKNVVVVVRAARVQNDPSRGVNNQARLESLLIHYQVEVWFGGGPGAGTPVLVVPYLKEVRF